MHGFYDFPYLGNVIIPTDELIFFREVGIPRTSELLHLQCHVIFIGLHLICTMSGHSFGTGIMLFVDQYRVVSPHVHI